MIRARLHARQAELAQPFAHRALAHRDRESPRDLFAQIDAAKANDLGIRPGESQFAQFCHLRRRQLADHAGRLARRHALHALFFVAMRPITQGLTAIRRLGILNPNFQKRGIPKSQSLRRLVL